MNNEHFDYKAMDAEDRAEQQEQIREQLLQEKQLSDALKRCFVTDDDELNEDARLIFDRLQGYCRAITPSFDPNPYTMAMLEGRRDVYNLFMRLLGFNINDYIEIKGNNDDDRNSTSPGE